MSILLEALRKSEKSQRSREVPTIHSEVASSPASWSFKQGGLVVLLVLTVIVSGWFVWNQYRASSGNGQTTTDGQIAPGRGETSTDIAQSSPTELPGSGHSIRNSADAGSQDSSAGDTQKNTSKDTQGRNQVAVERTPVESYRATEQNKGNTVKLAENPAAPRPSNTNDRPFPSTLKAGDAGKGADDPVKKAEKPYQPDAPGLLGYWDLPDSVRADVPEVTFSVLVYDKNPENRFVLINGERLTEGDAHQPGMVVEEIRRDGVVFSYRLYRFLIEK